MNDDDDDDVNEDRTHARTGTHTQTQQPNGRLTQFLLHSINSARNARTHRVNTATNK